MSVDTSTLVGPGQTSGFNDLYTAVYAILDDAKAERNLINLYKGSHLATNPHDSVLAFGEYFARHRRGLLSYACAQVNPAGSPQLEDLDTFDRTFKPRTPMRTVFAGLAAMLRKPGESAGALLAYLAGRTHALGVYRGGSSGFDEESRAVASVHFRQLGIPSRPEHVIISCGGAKGIFLAFCAALMCHRQFDELHHLGGVLLAPAGYYQSLRLIPAIFGGDIHVVSELTDASVARWLSRTADQPGRAMYVPLVNNATGEVLDAKRAQAVGREILSHNRLNRGNPVFVIGDDVYAGSYLDPHVIPMPIGAVPGLSLFFNPSASGSLQG